ncbi:translocation/assembly module TamB domain-containing protein [Sediminibacterium soli]|uniref:translocation/assembly module TamB domain-containing protein n=1 Tax=Sediminibacterium soli TaxID=2698829 RepID=UPI00137A5939|nr:translocation/assembly module TamB domain-containing protein [Sediminibacterium soli]NCI45868.1 hypothetical protein [Sediminibacterium soli]
MHYAAGKLSRALGTEVSIRSVNIALFNSLNMEGALIRDRQKDTLLYAGQLKVRITDWFFLKDKADLKYAGLEDATVYMNRKDSVWNYQFVLDYFRSPSTGDRKGGISLNLKKIDFKNVRFLQDDRWRGERMTVSVGSLLVDAENIDLPNNQYAINEITLDNPYFGIQNLPALRPDSLRPKPAGADTGLYFNPGNMVAKVGKIQIRNGNLYLDSDGDKPLPYFDGSHIRLSKLTGTIGNLSVVKDTLRAVVDLGVKDRSGIEIKKLKAHFRFTPQIMEFANLDLQTNKSRLTNYYAMRFSDFNRDFGDYTTRVKMDAHFSNAKVNSDDIAFFAPELRTWKKETTLSGNFHGTVADFTVHNLSARIGATTNVSGTLAMKGLPDIDRARISLNGGTLTTNHYDLGIFIPALKNVNSPNMAALGTILYRGNFNGTIHNFITAGSFSTQLGGVKTNISLQLPRSGDPVYTGDIETIRFNMGKFLNHEDLGLVDFKGKITGSSFNVDRLRTTLEGNISSLAYKNYTYTNIITNGTFQKKYFTGELKINDPNLDFNSQVEVDLTGQLPRFNIVGDLAHSNLKALNLFGQLKDSLQLTGLLDVNFTGTNIDNFLGTAKFLNAGITSPRVKLSFDSLNLVSEYVDSVKQLHLGSNELNATIRGQFNIQALPASFQNFLSHYYPAYIKPPDSIPVNQRFSFIVNTNYFEPYLALFDQKLSGFNDASVSGSIDTYNNSLNVVATVPFGKIGKISFTSLGLTGKGTIDTLSVRGTIGSVQATDSLRFPNTQFAIVSSNDHSEVSVKTSADNTLNDADLFADVYTLDDGVRVQFRPSSFVLNEKKWAIEKAGELTVRKHFVRANNIKFSQGFQEITVETEEEDGGNTQNLIVKLKNVIMGDLTYLLFKNPRLEGVTTGDIVLKNFFGTFSADAKLKAEQFRLDDDSVGLVNISAHYDGQTGDLPFTIESPNEGYRFTAKGSYNIKDTTGNSLTTDIQLQESQIDILHRFLNTLFSDMHGKATGNLSISGNLNAPNLLGRIKLRDASMKVNYTQVTYRIDSADINFQEDGIDFGNFRIRDRYNNTGSVSGKLYEKGFQDMRFDFDLSTDKLLLIDTRSSDNKQFYGKAIGRANLRFTGPEYNCHMSMTAVANDTSRIFIPNSITRQSGNADFIVFKQYGTEIAQPEKTNPFNLTVDLDLTANNNVKIDVILDELEGDVISAVGNGRLLMHAGTTESLTMRGRYYIDSGNYLFNLRGLIKRPFVLLPDAGNYIDWTGDPFRADLHIDAQYTAERVSLSELIGNNRFGSAVQGYRGDVYVIAQLRDKLTKPDIKFRLDFPQSSPVKSDNDFMQYLNRLEKDQNLLLNQVAYVIIFNQFVPAGSGSSSSSAFVNPYAITYNSLSQLLTKEVNKLFSNILYKITGDRSIRFDIGTSAYSSASIIDPTSAGAASRIDRTRVDLKLTRAFANDKIIVTVGSDIDFNVGSSVVSNGATQWLPNMNIEFILTKDRKLRLIIFNRNTLDLLSSTSFGRRNRQGISISYRKDFEKLFGKKEESIRFSPPADSTQTGSN